MSDKNLVPGRIFNIKAMQRICIDSIMEVVENPIMFEAASKSDANFYDFYTKMAQDLIILGEKSNSFEWKSGVFYGYF